MDTQQNEADEFSRLFSGDLSNDSWQEVLANLKGKKVHQAYSSYCDSGLLELLLKNFLNLLLRLLDHESDGEFLGLSLEVLEERAVISDLLFDSGDHCARNSVVFILQDLLKDKTGTSANSPGLVEDVFDDLVRATLDKEVHGLNGTGGTGTSQSVFK